MFSSIQAIRLIFCPTVGSNRYKCGVFWEIGSSLFPFVLEKSIPQRQRSLNGRPFTSVNFIFLHTQKTAWNILLQAVFCLELTVTTMVNACRFSMHYGSLYSCPPAVLHMQKWIGDDCAISCSMKTEFAPIQGDAAFNLDSAEVSFSDKVSLLYVPLEKVQGFVHLKQMARSHSHLHCSS